MKILLVGAAALMLASVVAPACSAAGANWLIGTWRYTGRGYVDREGHDWCAPTTEVIFTATAKTTINAATATTPAARGTTPVYYLATPKKVYVSATGAFGSGESWDRLGPNEMEDSTVGHCIFDRK
ncbi:MAG TPA: hypothetical protein VIJ94_04995 [Caulobacteraceae bacterium]